MKKHPVIGILLVAVILGGAVVGMTALAQGGPAGSEMPAVPISTPVALRTPLPAVTEVTDQTTPQPGSKQSLILTSTPGPPPDWQPAPGEEHKVPPTKALSPAQVAKLPPPPGTPAARLKFPVEYGRFRILPPGSVPRPLMGPPLPKGALKVVRSDIEGGKTEEACRRFALFADVKYVPAGWQFQGCDATILVWDDGKTTNGIYVASYWQPGYFPITIGRLLLTPGEIVDLVADVDTTGLAMTLSEVRGVPIVITHPAPGVAIQGPMEVDFVIDDQLIHIEGTGIEVEQLIRVTESFIAQVQAQDRGGKP